MWHCLGCNTQLDLSHTDAWCHRCLDSLREKLALQLLNGQWGFGFGPDLTTFFARPVQWSGIRRPKWELPVE